MSAQMFACLAIFIIRKTKMFHAEFTERLLLQLITWLPRSITYNLKRKSRFNIDLSKIFSAFTQTKLHW